MVRRDVTAAGKLCWPALNAATEPTRRHLLLDYPSALSHIGDYWREAEMIAEALGLAEAADDQRC